MGFLLSSKQGSREHERSAAVGVLYAVLSYWRLVALQRCQLPFGHSSILHTLTIASVWYSLVLVLIDHVSPQVPSNGLQRILKEWRNPDIAAEPLPVWPEDFSRGITPVPCHSHNDFWRRVPLYEALADGCTGVEADIWLPNDQNTSQELLVGYTLASLKPDRTLSNLYIQPLVNILKHMNAGLSITQVGRQVGVFETSPNTTLVLLLDFKSDSEGLWLAVQMALDPLRGKGWLRHWNGTSHSITEGPITIVATGNAPLDRILANLTYRDVFYDAPLDKVGDPLYNTSTSYYASTSLHKVVGNTKISKLSEYQKATVNVQITAATSKGLVSRYYDTPSWPIWQRDYVWSLLVINRVGMLNIDDLEAGSRWNWGWCVVAGLVLCG